MRGSARFQLVVPLSLQLVSLLTIIFFVGTRAWDDGTITLAFSRTFAQSGRIALTPISEQVEGFSSVSWFLLNAAVARFGPSFDIAIATSQIFAALFLAVSIAYLGAIARHLNLSTTITTLILVIAAVSGPSLAETANGMEMTLLAASGLAITYHLYCRRSTAMVLIATIVFVATRFEAIFYLFFLVSPLVLYRRGKEALGWCLVGGVTFGMLEGARYLEFSDLLPNTVYAKMNPPYRVAGIDAVIGRIRASLDLFEALTPIALLGPAYWLFGRSLDRAHLGPPAQSEVNFLRVLVMAVIGVEIFSIVSGRNWGYPGRMQFLAIPYALLLSGYAYDRLARYSTVGIRRLAFMSALLTVPVSWAVAARQEYTAIKHSFVTTGHRSAEYFDVTPEAFGDTGRSVDRIRRLLGMESIVFMTPDVGGVGLCCSHIRVVDIGLLTNSELARSGYSAFPSVYSKEKPDVIGIHETWAGLSGIYNMPRFTQEYVPLFIDDTRLFLRNDHAAALLAKGAGRMCPMTDSRCSREVMILQRYREHSTPGDDAQFMRYPAFVEVP